MLTHAVPSLIEPDLASSLNLLVVDDDALHRAIIARAGRQSGYRIEEAQTLDAVREIIPKRQIACVTLDLSLGRNGGFDVIRHFSDVGFDRPILVISGSDERVRNDFWRTARALRANVVESFGKPLKIAQLRAALQDLNKRQAVGLTPRAI